MTAKRGRPRRTASQTSEKQQQIVAAARTLFMEEGFDSVSMRKIAAEAGMGTMTLYQYFPGKAEILHHIWGEFFDDVFQRMADEIARAPDAVTALRAASHTYLNYFLENPDHFRVIFSYEDRADANDQFFVDHARIDDRLRDIYAPIRSELNLTQQQMSTLTQALNCYLHGVLLNLITISELEWAPGPDLLNHYLDAVLAPYRR